MKFTFLMFMGLFALTHAWSQSDITPAVSAALKKGDAATLSTHLMPQIELSLPGKEGLVAQSQAQQLLDQFFKEHVPHAFTLKHQGTSKLDDQFRIGELSTSKGVFRVTFFMKKSATTLQIKQLKIEPVG